MILIKANADTVLKQQLLYPDRPYVCVSVSRQNADIFLITLQLSSADTNVRAINDKYKNAI